ncbi:hypothetical protein [Kytococcus schroeteri]|uniref:restriction endonuclease subunit S n=1 Tax=Kytococcus schroeteri TaxID=138300 RepID=UPI00114115A1|nr:hypothetical protein [Kytococcus schroeteri]
MKTVPLRRLASMTYGDALSTDSREAGPVPVMSSGGRTGWHSKANTRAPVIVVGRKGSHGSLWWSDEPAFVIDTAYSVDASNTEANLRWLYYVLQTLNLSSLSNDVGVPGLSRAAAYERRVADIEPAEQQRIADFLDDRVGRIDRIIAARREQAQLVVARERSEWALADQSLVDLPHVPLRRVVRSIADGPFGSSLSSRHYSDSGVRVIRLGNVGIGQFRNHDKAYIPDAYGEQLKQFRVSAGEVIMAGLGDERWPLGRCAVVPRDIGPAINKADCYRLQLSDEVSAQFIALNLSGPRSESETALLARGSTRARLNTEIAGDRTVPLAPEPRQAEYVRTVERARAETKDATGALTRSIDLLTEYKQSLITAAVTGQLDVTTASTRIPE